MEFWALGFALSIYLSLQLPNLLPATWLILFSVICALWLLGQRFKLLTISRMSSGAFFAAILVFVYVHLFYSQDFLVTPNQRYSITGEVVNHPQAAKCNPQYCFVKLIIRPKAINGQSLSRINWAKKRLSISWVTKHHELLKGDVIEFEAKLNRPIGYENEFGFSFSKWAFSEGIYAKGTVKSDVTVLMSNPKLSQKLLNKLTTHFSSLHYDAYLYPLILAETALLQRDEKEQLKILGLSHLFAISGLHIGVLYLLLLYLLRLLVACFFLNKLSLSLMKLFCLVLIWCYVGLIDFPVSATRAACLLSVWLLVSVTKRHWRKSQIFSAMVCLTLLLHPPAILAIGWWLSVWAVAGIFIFIDTYSISDNVSDSGKLTALISKIKSLVIFQIFISIWMLPVTLFWFSGYSILGLWFNLFLTPLFAVFVIPAVFIAVLFLVVDLPSWSIWLAQWINDLFQLTFASELALNPNMAWMNVSSAVWIPVLFITLVIVCFKTGFRLMHYAISSLFILTFLLSKIDFKPLDVKMTVLDVGQGTSVAIQQNDRALIYDLGPLYPSGMSATELVVKPFLIGEGVTNLDYVFVSHQDSDHTGDITKLAYMNIAKVIDSCNFSKLTWLRLTLEQLWPRLPEQVETTDNDKSCVVMVTERISKQRVLLTGDISRTVELELVKLHQNGQINLSADILLSPHHGSRTSSSYPFIKAVSPEAVVHTAGIYNHFGFPANEVKKRYENMGVTQYSTSHLGQIDIYFTSKNKDWLAKFWRNAFSPFWKKQNPFSFQ